MGITTRCRGRSLYNHLKQKNIDISLEYTYDKPTLSWSGSFSVYGKSYHVENKQSKNLVLEALMEESTQYILSHIKVKESHK